MIAHKDLHFTPQIQRWVLLPLRLFLGITFVYAGIQKLTDSQFFRSTAPGYIGKQITAFATSSPLHNFLIQVAAPHATLFGLLVIYGEITIGLAALLGFLLRPAALFGVLISMLFFLSATWRVFPYFYGSDIVFAFCWLTLLLNGPRNTGLPTADEQLIPHLIHDAPLSQQALLARIASVVLGIATPLEQNTAQQVPSQPTRNTHGIQQRRLGAIQRAQEVRRNFILGALTGSFVTFGLGAFTYALYLLTKGPDEGNPPTSTLSPQIQPPTSDNGTPSSAPNNTTATGTTGTSIAQVTAVPANSAVSFTIPSTGDPGVLVHLKNGQFVAYDALCTHAGCQVDYDPTSQLLLCPCHGAAFDPAQQAAVVQSPAPTPLSPVAIHVDSATGAITLS